VSRVKNRLFKGGSFGVLALLLSLVVGAPSAIAQGPKATMTPKEAQKRIAKSSKYFVENKGQWDKRAKFVARTPNLNVWLTSTGLVFDNYKTEVRNGRMGKTGHVVGMNFLGARKDATVVGLDKLNRREDYLFSRKGHVTGVGSYSEAVIKNLYAGIDVRNYFDGAKTRYDVVVAPGANASQVKFTLDGANKVSVDKKGNLIIGTNMGDAKHANLLAYQSVWGHKLPVSASFKQIGEKTVAFNVGSYDKTRTLVIDPLVYGSYYGSDGGMEEVRGIVADSDGGVYLTGSTTSNTFPAIYGPYGFGINGPMDAYVAKLQGDAYDHDYAAYLGGSGDDCGEKVQIDPFGNLWVAGRTASGDFPGNTRAIAAGTTDIFVIRFAKSAATVLDPLPTQTYMIGGDGDEPPGGTLQPFGRFYNSLPGFGIIPKTNPQPTDPVEIVIAATTDFDVPGVSGTRNAVDGFIYRVNYQGGVFTDVSSACVYVGGSFDDDIEGLAVDDEGSVYVAGTVFGVSQQDTALNPAAFETTPGVFFEGRLLRQHDAFIRKYDRNGLIQYSALIGGNDKDNGYGIAVDPFKNAYVTGIARSFNFPRTLGVFGEVFNNLPNVFVTKINTDASQIVYSTNLRTLGSHVLPKGVAVDGRGQAFVVGMVGYDVVTFPNPPTDPNEPNFSSGSSIPTSPGALQPAYVFPATPDIPTYDGFILALNPTATELLYGSYIGGLADEQTFAPYVDRFGDVWIMGSTDSYRRFERVSSTGSVNVRQIAGALPTQWISPLAFKSSPDNTNPPTAIAGVPYGLLQGPGVAPATITVGPPNLTGLNGYKRDGFLIKLRLDLPVVQNVTLNPSTIAGGLGASSVGTITLSKPVPAGGINIIVSVNNAAASFDPNNQVNSISVPVAQGATTATFTVYSNPVTAPTQVQVKASLEGNFRIAQLTVVPWLSQLTVSPTNVVGGNLVVGRIKLFQTAIQDVVVSLSSDNSGLLSFPSTVTVPAGLDTVTFDINTEGVTGNVDVPITASFLGVGRTQTITLRPANLASVTFSPTRVTGGTQAIGKVTLDGEAGGTFTVDLTIDAGTPGYVVTPLTLTFNQGDTEKTFTVDTVYEPVSTQRRITATRPAQGPWIFQQIQGTLFIDAANLIGFVVNPSSIPVGGTSVGTVTISAPAAAGGAIVTLSSSNPAVASVPAQVVVQPGATAASFNITATTTAITSDTPVVISATRGPTTINRTVTVERTTLGLDISPSTIPGGATATGTITLGAPAPVGGLVVNLSSNIPEAQVPPTVTVLAGQTTASFNITTSNVTSTVTANITAQAGTLSASASLEIRPIGVTSIVFSPNVVRGGTSTSCTVTIEAPAPAGGATVALNASPGGIAILPSNVVIGAGQTSITFTVQTRRVSRTVSTVVTATYNLRSASATLTVKR
jgi:hypothetical protein